MRHGGRGDINYRLICPDLIFLWHSTNEDIVWYIIANLPLSLINVLQNAAVATSVRRREETQSRRLRNFRAAQIRRESHPVGVGLEATAVANRVYQDSI